jgi:acetoin utilization deacetylase AcuC-like enzyme
MKAFYSDEFTFPLPEGHRFPTRKYSLLRESIQRSGLLRPEDLLVPQPVDDAQILLAHDPEYLQRVKEGALSALELRRIGLPWSPELVLRARYSAGGTVAACRTALDEGVAVNLAGGTHHAFADHGQGFCLFNDAVIAARVMQAAGRAHQVVILDCDVHQGNGTAALAAADPTIFTFSVHNQDNFPLHKVASDLDIGLRDGTGDAVYLGAVADGVRRALALALADLAIYLAGADPYEGDLLGRMAVSKEALAARDRLVLDMCRNARLPVAVTLAGGYGRRVEDTVEIHLQTVRIAAEMAATWPVPGQSAHNGPREEKE